MNRVSLDDEVDAVKRFFLTLPPDPQGCVIELNGAALVHVGRIAPISDDGQWTDAKEERRRILIDKQIESGLTPAELFELDFLRAGMLKYRQRLLTGRT